MSPIPRAAEARLAAWLGRAGRKPLVIRGARQVGKSTLVRMFAASRDVELFEINLERHPELDVVFGTLDITRILRELEGLTGTRIGAAESARAGPTGILFLDEIQATPRALQALRYFHEDRPDLPVIAAGSLLEFALGARDLSMPVGRVEYLHLHPFTFEEFLGGLEERHLLEYLAQLSCSKEPSEQAHRRLLALQREFLFVGGMPEAVQTYVANRDLARVVETHASIVETYQDDFAKYGSRTQVARLRRVFDYSPRAVGNKVKYVNISRDDAAREMREAVDLLVRAGVVVPVFHSDCSGVPLSAGRDPRTYKLVFVDVGLLGRVCRLDWRSVASLDERQLVNEGPLAEQFIGQGLLANQESFEKPELDYWLREKKSSNAEVDFVISRGTRVIPIEVKAGKSGSLKSLQQFALAKGSPLCVRFDLNQPSALDVSHGLQGDSGTTRVSFKLVSLPLYAVGQVPRLVDSLPV